MPLYEYRCGKCGHYFTAIHTINDRKVPESSACPECAECDSVKQSISAPLISYSNPGSMKTTDSFNDRLKDIKKSIPKRFQGSLSDNIR